MNSPGREKSEALNGETRLTRQRTLLPHSQLDSSNGNATSERLTKILKSFAWKLLLSRGGKCSMAIFQGWIISLLCCNFLCTEMIEKYKKSWKFVQSILDKKDSMHDVFGLLCNNYSFEKIFFRDFKYIINF